MIYERSLKLSTYISNIIAHSSFRVGYSDNDLLRAQNAFSEQELEEMLELGLYDGDFEKFYVINEFCKKTGIDRMADGIYLLKLFKNAKKLSAESFESDPYIKNVKFGSARKKDVLLTMQKYSRGEVFQYDMPDLFEQTVTPKLGFFNKEVSFPAVYEGNTPWMSVCPSEIESMKKPIESAHGRVLVLGLGLGYYPYMIASKQNVHSIDVIEINPSVCELFCENVLPAFDSERQNKTKIICEDAIKYLESTPNGAYDFCFADIWEGAADGVVAYRKIKTESKRLYLTEFSYWIEDQLKFFE